MEKPGQFSVEINNRYTFLAEARLILPATRCVKEMVYSS